jgi:putative membrane protein
MSISTALFWVLMFVGIVLVARYLGDHRPQQPDRPARLSSAEQILAERLARGEIDEDEFRRRLEALRGQADSRAR